MPVMKVMSENEMCAILLKGGFKKCLSSYENKAVQPDTNDITKNITEISPVEIWGILQL